jgi:hypothetical protein
MVVTSTSTKTFKCLQRLISGVVGVSISNLYILRGISLLFFAVLCIDGEVAGCKLVGFVCCLDIDSSAFWALEYGFMGDEMKDECCRITKLVA